MIREAPLLMKVGVIVITLALALAIVAVVVSIAVRSVPQQAVASERLTTTESPVQRLIPGESSYESWIERARHLLTPEVAKGESDPEPSGREPKPGFTLNPKTEPRSQTESFPKPQAQAEPQVQPESQIQPVPSAQEEPKAQSQSEPEQRYLPAGESDWQRPTRQEVEAANEPRHYKLPAGAIMGLTIEAIGIYSVPVFDSNSQWALANGVAHNPQTSLPWSQSAQRNVYLAGHRMGYRGTWSRMIFYNLDKLKEGDKVVLKDRTGRSYE